MGRNLEGKMEARQIVRKAGLDDRPEFYSGRGATSSDLNDQILERVYNVVNQEYGEEVSKQFVQMVADITVLSATDFLNSLYGLESMGWKWDKKLASRGGIDVGPDNGSREGIGTCTIFNAFSGMSSQDETGYIRGPFLIRHGVKNSRDHKDKVCHFDSWSGSEGYS